MACVETNVPPVGTAPPVDGHEGGGFVRMERCGSPTFWVNDINANCHSIFNLKAINCIPISSFLTNPLQVDLNANGHAITNVGKILVGTNVDDGSGALLQVAGEINAQSYMVRGIEFADPGATGQVELNNISTINGQPIPAPLGVEGSVQFNDDGQFKGDAYFTYDEITRSVRIGIQSASSPQWRLDIGGDVDIADPSRSLYAYRINGIPFAMLNANMTHIDLVNVGLINGQPPGTGGSGSAPGGITGEVQFNSGGLFAASANLFWDITNSRLGIGTSTPVAPLTIRTGTNLNLSVSTSPVAGVRIAASNDSGSTGVPLDLFGSLYTFMGGFIGIGTSTPAYNLDMIGEARITVSDAAHLPLRLVGGGGFTILDLINPNTPEADIFFQIQGGVTAKIAALPDRLSFSYSTDNDVLSVHVNGINVNNGTITMPNIPVTAPPAGSKQIWADPADGYRLKLAN